MVKPGIKSTEFWGMVLAQVFNLASLFGAEIDVDHLLIVNGAAAAYAAFRSLVKWAGAWRAS